MSKTGKVNKIRKEEGKGLSFTGVKRSSWSTEP